MSERYESGLGSWGSRWTFILAATGSAVGLGNIWKFPYMAGENGGAAFVAIYLLCLFLVGVPLLMAEVLLGRRGGQNPVGSMAKLTAAAGTSRAWIWTGRLGALAGFIILSFYSVVGGFSLAYVFNSAFGDFVGAGPEDVAAVFSAVQSSAVELTGWHTLFLVLVMIVSLRGINQGLEKSLRIIMPMLFILLAVLLWYAWEHGDFDQGLAFLFDFSAQKITWQASLDALGHAFFSLSLGMGVMMAYGAYMPKSASIGGAVVAIALLDTVVALSAGLIIFPIVFANGLDPTAGFGLMFNALPLALGNLPFGHFVGTLFFVLIALAAWSSAISILEPAVAWSQQRWRCSRTSAVVVVGCAAWLLGLGTVFSFNIWADATLLGANFFGWIDFVSSSLMLPIVGLLVAVFAGWKLDVASRREELAMRWAWAFSSWQWLLKYLVPVAVVAILAISAWGFVSALQNPFD
ncbi:sodium-dependent transporter [Hydrocarboniclastica marina]|uniref:Transporter n=1 Tax=Hydrocarboniclastica marina TaxID=2259620 RepID=A0A4P7XKP6_9ALTE|nr:sodium-dependent transporter [Hydrocarboniclastica marina]QCF26912.1 sodium-dependent transporter [Hydrocarboniclastica marina]